MKPTIETRRHLPNSKWTYADLQDRQLEVLRGIQAGGAGALLISEVAPVVTLGRRTPESHLIKTSEEFQKAHVEILKTDRGGLATYHGPGQWVVFAVDQLERLVGDRRGVKKAVCELLEATRQSVSHLEPKAEIRSGEELGVWGPRGKIAALGVHVVDGVLLHGVCINGFRTRESFFGLVPCGLSSAPAFLLEDLGDFAEQEAQFLGLRKRIEDAFGETLWSAPRDADSPAKSAKSQPEIQPRS